ncbi:hypothetical protein M3Y97_00110900 [Aphelenchoides bicaudatus]|nr:hypothetical protein M3Y97_00110900 [Aphelenchoides bicaudatus]
MAEPMELDDPQLPPFETLHLLKLIKDSQQKHGLRHNDYKRYSDYCDRRIRRIRKTLKFTNLHRCVPKHRAKFVGKKVTADVVTDLKFVELLTYQVEHCWARGMEFKFASEDEHHTRQKFHARRRLGKAMKHAEQLDSIAKTLPRIDSLTKLEAQAYFNYISAAFYLEKKEWQAALDNYRQSKAIYEKLSKIAQDSYLTALYDNRCRELTGMIKVCEFNCSGNTNMAASAANMAGLKLDDDSMNIDNLIADAETTLSAKSATQPKAEKKTKKGE